MRASYAHPPKSLTLSSAGAAVRILGIDPGSNATGYGVVESRDGKLFHVAHGVLRPPRGAAFAQRLD